MHTKTDSTQLGSGLRILGYVLTLLFGATLGLLFAPKDGSALRSGLVKKMKNLSTRFNRNREQLQTDIQEIWGEVTDELEQDYSELRNKLFASLEEVKDKANLTRKKYDELVDDIVDSYSEERDWKHSSVSRLQKHIKNEWEGIKDHFLVNA